MCVCVCVCVCVCSMSSSSSSSNSSNSQSTTPKFCKKTTGQIPARIEEEEEESNSTRSSSSTCNLICIFPRNRVPRFGREVPCFSKNMGIPRIFLFLVPAPACRNFFDS